VVEVVDGRRRRLEEEEEAPFEPLPIALRPNGASAISPSKIYL
jgi:hypothetical protein